jgi:hypothetical protein
MMSLETIRERNANAVDPTSPATPEPRVWLGNPNNFLSSLPVAASASFLRSGWVRSARILLNIDPQHATPGYLMAILTPGRAYAILHRFGDNSLAVAEYERTASERKRIGADTPFITSRRIAA